MYDNLNRPHKFIFTEGQASTILYILDQYLELNGGPYDPDVRQDIDDIYEELEGTIDEFYDRLEAARRKQPDMEW